jgi:RNA polymerase sigma factor (sigma-70 family)
MTDQEILTGLSQNDATTTTHVYQTLAPPIFKYVLSNSGTRDEAKDLFQETFIRVLKKIQDGRYNHREKFEAYFITVARNTWIDQLRAKKQRPLPTDDEWLWQCADDSDEESLLQLVLRDRRMEALQQVWTAWDDTGCHRILHRFHYDNVRTKDLALEENTSQNTLLQRLYKCRIKLFRLVSRQMEKI